MPVISLLTSSVVGLAGSAAAYYSPFALRLHRVNALRKRVTADRTLVLSYDDGPSRSTTPEILRLLQLHDAKATFFMLGESARQNADVADRVVEDGHDVGCHTDRHLNAWKVHPRAAINDINAGYHNLAAWVDRNGMYRPPFGKMTLPTSYAIWRRGAYVGWWTIDSGDTRSALPQPEDVADRLAREGGGIVLMHDLDRTNDRNNFVLETTARLLDLAKQESFNVKRLSELCY